MENPQQVEFTLGLLYNLERLPPPAEDVAVLANRYSHMCVVFSALSVTERSRGFRAHADHLTRLASVSAFLASVQIGFIAFTAGVSSDRNENTGSMWTALNFFSFFSLFLDTFSAFFCLLFTDQLSKRLEACHSLTDEKRALDFKIAHFATLRGNHDQAAADKFFVDNKVATEMRDFMRKIWLTRLEKTIYHPSAEEHVVKATILLSIVSFTLALALFIRETQERLVWLTTLPISAGIAFLLIVNNHRSRFRGFPQLDVEHPAANPPHP